MMFLRLLAFIGALAVVAAVTVGVYLFGGYYNIAASQPDNDIIALGLGQIRAASINRHGNDALPAGMDDPDKVQAGARAFLARGCPSCHGGPGVTWAKFSEGLRPAPADLKETVRDLTAAQIFWIVKNGVNMTGMPSFATADVPDDEIWKIAAFTKKLPDVSEADFKTWTVDAPTVNGAKTEIKTEIKTDTDTDTQEEHIDKQ